MEQIDWTVRYAARDDLARVNELRGRDDRVNRVMKWLFYLYYPLHLLLIGILSA